MTTTITDTIEIGLAVTDGEAEWDTTTITVDRPGDRAVEDNQPIPGRVAVRLVDATRYLTGNKMRVGINAGYNQYYDYPGPFWLGRWEHRIEEIETADIGWGDLHDGVTLATAPVLDRDDQPMHHPGPDNRPVQWELVARVA